MAGRAMPRPLTRPRRPGRPRDGPAALDRPGVARLHGRQRDRRHAAPGPRRRLAVAGRAAADHPERRRRVGVREDHARPHHPPAPGAVGGRGRDRREARPRPAARPDGRGVPADGPAHLPEPVRHLQRPEARGHLPLRDRPERPRRQDPRRGDADRRRRPPGGGARSRHRRGEVRLPVLGRGAPAGVGGAGPHPAAAAHRRRRAGQHDRRVAPDQHRQPVPPA